MSNTKNEMIFLEILARGKCLSIELNLKKLVAVCTSVVGEFHNEMTR